MTEKKEQEKLDEKKTTESNSTKITEQLNQPIGGENTPILGVKQYEAGQQLLQKFIKGISVKVKGNKVDITYHWELPNEQMAKALAEGTKAQFGGT